MKTTAIGREAETAVAEYLSSKKFKIIDRNWRTRWCEIDVVATKDNVAYFIEVKYRTSSAQGSGFEYIGPSKLRQLCFAADFWASQHNWNADCLILGAQVTGLNYESIELVEIS